MKYETNIAIITIIWTLLISLKNYFILYFLTFLKSFFPNVSKNKFNNIKI